MSFNVRKLPCEPITVYTAQSSDLDHMEQNNQIMLDMLDQLSAPVFHIADMRPIKLNVDSLMQLAASVAYGEHSVLRHPMIKELILVTDSRLIAMAGDGLSSDIYGNLPVKIFGSLDEALQYARAQIGQTR